MIERLRFCGTMYIFIQIAFALSSSLEEEQDLDRLTYTDINDRG